MATVDKPFTIKWDLKNQVSKLGQRIKWASRRQMVPDKLFNIKWASVGTIFPMTLTLKWDLERVIVTAWHYRIYTLPASNRIYKIPITTTHI